MYVNAIFLNKYLAEIGKMLCEADNGDLNEKKVIFREIDVLNSGVVENTNVIESAALGFDNINANDVM